MQDKLKQYDLYELLLYENLIFCQNATCQYKFNLYHNNYYIIIMALPIVIPTCTTCYILLSINSYFLTCLKWLLHQCTGVNHISFYGSVLVCWFLQGVESSMWSANTPNWWTLLYSISECVSELEQILTLTLIHTDSHNWISRWNARVSLSSAQGSSQTTGSMCCFFICTVSHSVASCTVIIINQLLESELPLLHKSSIGFALQIKLMLITYSVRNFY